MIDIHSHVLPGLDDGARTMEESLAMLRMAADCGTTDIVATPHANAEFPFDETRVRQVFDELVQKSSDFIQLHLGCDFHLNYENLQGILEQPGKYSINGRRYLMVELPDMVSTPSVRLGLERLLDARLSPIITHPERNVAIQSKIEELKRWIENGCFVQITGQSLLGRFGTKAQKSAEGMIKAGLVHFVASDAHDCIDRPPDLSKAYEYVSTQYGSEYADKVFVENPTAALWGELIELQLMVPRKKSRLAFWK